MSKQGNHEANKAESLADLELTTEPAEQTKGGTEIRGGRADDVIDGGTGAYR